MDIKCIYDEGFGGFITYVEWEDGTINYDDFTWTEEELFIEWRLDLDRYFEQVKAQVLAEMDVEKNTIDC